ncbi:MAG: FkbM family methyltransferase [Nitrospiraceae bacterium]|nr:FkbM family methyltransferase [Nitrospiraceae bacterium]
MHKRSFHFSPKDKIAFYWNYFSSKVIFLWFEVKRPKTTVFLYEIIYSFLKIFNRSSLFPSPFSTSLVVTRFGAFRIRPHTVDMSNCSPAFERKDIDYLLKTMEGLIREGERILFFDIGADIGTFTVTLGNRYRGYENLSIMAFEPALSSYEILKENISLNDLSGKAVLFNFALFSKDNVKLEFQFNSNAPGSSGIKMSMGGDAVNEIVPAKTLDAVVENSLDGYDVLIFKMDVEGAEIEVLKGALKALNSGKKIILLVEDFVNPAIIEYLQGIGADFLCKLTPYNSWWHYRRSL